MAVPKKKKSLMRRRYTYFVKKRKNIFKNYTFYKKCDVCSVYIRNHTYCLNCI